MDREIKPKRSQISPALYQGHREWAGQRRPKGEHWVYAHHRSSQWKLIQLYWEKQGRQEAGSGRNCGCSRLGGCWSGMSLMRRAGRDGVA